MSILCVLLAAGCGDDAPQVLEQSTDPVETIESSTAKTAEIAPPEGLSSSEWKQVKAQVALEQRRIEWDDQAPVSLGGEGAWRALNPGNALAAWMGPKGVVVRPIDGDKQGDEQDAPAWQLELALDGVGRAGSLQHVSSGEVSVDGSRLEIERGHVTEWYINDERGLEQGFDIQERPDGTGELVVEVGFSSDLIPHLVDETTVDLKSKAGESVLGYSGLVAWDAKGKALAAHMELGDDHGVRLVVDDAEAVYPVTVDPWIERKKIVPSDGAADDEFGYSVSVSGDVMVVGAPGDGNSSGSAYIFERNQGGTNNFGQVKKLVASDSDADDFFGNSVSVSGDVVVVGATQDDDNGRFAGSVYVFERNHGGTDNFGQLKKLLASDGSGIDMFGYSVSVSGDVVVVGTHRDDDKGSDSGSVYVFERNTGGTDNFGQLKKLLASDGASGDQFGQSVSVSGDMVVVGAPGDENSSGSAYIFERNQGGTDNFGQVKKIVPSDSARIDHFGDSVSVSGDVVVVGAWGDDDNGSSSGSAYIFERNQGGTNSFGQLKKLVASDGAADDRFGWTVSVSGVVVVVGAQYDDDNGSNAGSAYVFERNQGGTDNFGRVKKLLASDGAGGHEFSHSVSVSGDVVVVGARRDDDNGSWSGSAYVFEFINTPPAATDDTASVDEDGAVTVDVLANDTDANAHPLTVDSVTQPTNGTVTNNGTDLTYTPDADYFGNDSFTYTVSDGRGGTDTAAVSVTVDAVHDAPVFVAPTPADQDVLTVVEADTLTMTLAADDIDADTLTYDIAPLPSGATLDTATGAFSWTPTWQDAGTHQLTLSVTDGDLSDTRQISVEVSFIDDDADGLPDTWETENGLDPGTEDSDGDGISDADEAGDELDNPRDTDNDGVIDVLDDDADGDGISDADEVGDDDPATTAVDTDEDGTPDYLDTDSDDDTVDDGTDNCPLVENTGQTDTDQDGTGDACEDDIDGDGIPDAIEEAMGLDPFDVDSDGDGVADGEEFGDDTENPVDTDQDGVIDALDEDSDGDGILDGDEAGDDDTDGDGTPDYRDLDSDDDTVDDDTDNCRMVENSDQLDTDGDGAGDVCDGDIDGDGVDNDVEEELGLDPNVADSDGDGVPDGEELGDDPQNPVDSDGDGEIDALDNTLDRGAAEDGCGCSSASAPANALSVVFVLLGLVGLRLGRRWRTLQ